MSLSYSFFTTACESSGYTEKNDETCHIFVSFERRKNDLVLIVLCLRTNEHSSQNITNLLSGRERNILSRIDDADIFGHVMRHMFVCAFDYLYGRGSVVLDLDVINEYDRFGMKTQFAQTVRTLVERNEKIGSETEMSCHMKNRSLFFERDVSEWQYLLYLGHQLPQDMVDENYKTGKDYARRYAEVQVRSNKWNLNLMPRMASLITEAQPGGALHVSSLEQQTPSSL